MKRLSLLRHAKSSWDDAGLSDEQRPLNPRGQRDAPRMGARLAARKLRPSLIMTSRIPALNMVRNLLYCAEQNGADVIATACPLCQINLECYQNAVNEEFGTDFHLPILYFTQLIGVALGISPKKLGFGIEMVSAKPIFKKLLAKEAN